MGETLPANRSAAVQPALPELDAVEADHFDGWAPAEVRAEVLRLVPGLSRAEMMTDHYRRLVGLALYSVLANEGEKVAGEHLAQIIAETGAAASTLKRWRTDAQRHFKLPDPTPRASSQSKRRLIASRDKSENTPAPIEAASTALDDPPPPAPARTPDRSKPAPAKAPPERPQARSERLHAGCPSCRCVAPKPTGVQGKACSHPIIRRNGRYCMDCGGVWK